MAEYIGREAAINTVYSMLCRGDTNDVNDLKNLLLVSISELPAADVVEVDVKDLRVKKAIQALCEFYSTAKKSDYVQKPLAWALYQTWKSFDKMDGGGDK